MFLLWLRQLPWCGDLTPALKCPHLLRAGPVLLTLLFFSPSPFILLSFVCSIYSFPLVRSSCPLSAGVLHALLCLKLYSWCICGERHTPCPPTPLPFLYLPIIWLDCSFLWYWAAWAACIFQRLILCQLLHLQIFSPILRVALWILNMLLPPSGRHFHHPFPYLLSIQV